MNEDEEKDIRFRECAVIGGLACYKENYEKIEILDKNDFKNNDNKSFFEVIKRLHDRGENEINLVMIKDEMMKIYPSLALNAVTTLAGYFDKAISSECFEMNVKRLKKYSYARKIKELAEKLDDVEKLDELEEIIRSRKDLENITGDEKQLILLSETKNADYTNRPKVLSGLKEIDDNIGGFYMGDISVWTGKTGQGKSTFVNQMVCESVNQGIKVFIYSGELINEQLKNWLYLQLAGEMNLVKIIDEQTGKINWGVTHEIERKIDAWISDKIIIYNNNFSTKSIGNMNILEACRKALAEYNCKVFVIDNLMSARYLENSKDDYYTQQSKFVGELASFAKLNKVHVHLIAHPKKTQGRDVENEDISGTMDIANRADNVFVISRNETKNEADKSEPDGYFTIKKNRSHGVSLSPLKVFYEKKSHRFMTQKSFETKHYGWERRN